MSLSTIALLRQLIAVKIIHISSVHYQLSIVSSNGFKWFIPILQQHASSKFEAVCETLKSKTNILQARLIFAAVTSQGSILFSIHLYSSPASLAVG